MQFVFGNNGSSYAILGTDDKLEDAERLAAAIGLSGDAMTDNRPIYGYRPFKGRTPQALFFCFFHDSHFVRNSYLLHGFRKDAPDGYYDRDFLEDLWLQYVDQAQADQIRDANDLTKVPEISHVAKQKPKLPLNETTYRLILSRMLRKKAPLTLIIDDSFYNEEALRYLLHLIYSRLPTPLRRWFSFVTGVDVGGKDDLFRLHIVTENMLRSPSDNTVDLREGASNKTDSGEAAELAEYLYTVKSDERNALFSEYNRLFPESFDNFSTENFLSFRKIRSGSEDCDPDALINKAIELASDCDPVLPDCLKTCLQDRYESMDEASLKEEISFSSFSVFDPDAYINENSTAFRKAVLSSEKVRSYLRKWINEAYSDTGMTYELHGKSLPASDYTETDTPTYRFFAETVDNGQKFIWNDRCREYEEELNDGCRKIFDYIQENKAKAIAVIDNPQLPSKITDRILQYNPSLLKNDYREYFCRYAEQELQKLKEQVVTTEDSTPELLVRDPERSTLTESGPTGPNPVVAKQYETFLSVPLREKVLSSDDDTAAGILFKALEEFKKNNDRDSTYDRVKVIFIYLNAVGRKPLVRKINDMLLQANSGAGLTAYIMVCEDLNDYYGLLHSGPSIAYLRNVPDDRIDYLTDVLKTIYSDNPRARDIKYKEIPAKPEYADILGYTGFIDALRQINDDKTMVSPGKPSVIRKVILWVLVAILVLAAAALAYLNRDKVPFLKGKDTPSETTPADTGTDPADTSSAAETSKKASSEEITSGDTVSETEPSTETGAVTSDTDPKEAESKDSAGEASRTSDEDKPAETTADQKTSETTKE